MKAKTVTRRVMSRGKSRRSGKRRFMQLVLVRWGLLAPRSVTYRAGDSYMVVMRKQLSLKHCTGTCRGTQH